MHAIDAGMGELVAIAGGAVKLDIIVARNGSEENFVRLGVDGGEYVNIAAAALHVGHVAISVDATDVDREWFGGDVDINFV